MLRVCTTGPRGHVARPSGAQPIVVGKPEPPLFRIALARLGLAPGQPAMVGDSVESDVAGGRRAGMRTVLYPPEGEPPTPPTSWSDRSPS